MMILMGNKYIYTTNTMYIEHIHIIEPNSILVSSTVLTFASADPEGLLSAVGGTEAAMEPLRPRPALAGVW